MTGPKEGFYLSHQIRNGKQTAILAVAVDNNSKKKTDLVKSKKDQLYQVYRPNTGLQFRNETLGELEKKYKKVIIKLLVLVEHYLHIKSFFYPRYQQMMPSPTGQNSMNLQ